MTILDENSRSIVNMLFALVGIWMAHAFYQSPRKSWQVVTAWVVGFAYCTAAAMLLEWLGWFPSGTHEHLSNAVGFGAIFVYIYLFPQIPIAQRIFTYFFIDNSLYILILLARLTAMPLTGVVSLTHSALFTVAFLLLAAAFLVVFARKLREPILQGLSAFRNRLQILTIYACVSYMTMLAMVDPWAPMQPITPGRGLSMLLLSSASVCGYLLAFHLMRSIRREHEAQTETRELAALLKVSQRYYGSLVDGIEQERALRHDFIHHLRIMDALQKDGRQDELALYLAKLMGRTQAKTPKRWCACYVANVLLDHYASQASDAGVECSFDAVIPEWDSQDSPGLCVVLGNLLQNALEACQRVPQDRARFISLLARVVNGNLTIEVKNSFDGVVELQDGRLASRKQDAGHGLGITSVRNMAESKGGYFETDYDTKVFKTRVILPMPAEAANIQNS